MRSIKMTHSTIQSDKMNMINSIFLDFDIHTHEMFQRRNEQTTNKSTLISVNRMQTTTKKN